MSGLQKMPGDGSGISRVGTWRNPLLDAGRRNRFYLENGARAAGSRVGAVDILGNHVEILGNVEIYPEVGNVEILGGPEAHISATGHAMMPLTDPIMREVPRPMFRSMVRLMGESSIQQRRWGNRSLWEGTPIASLVPAGLGEPFDVTYDAAELLEGIESLGWEWDFKADLLKAHVRTSRGMTTVTIPGAKVKAIFMKAYREAYGMVAPHRFQSKATCGDLFSDIGNFITKEIPKAVKNVEAGIGSFAKNPGKWIEGAAKDIGRVAEDVVSNVVSSEVFAGVMGAIAVIPPLQAVGGLGLAAYGIAKTAKTVIQAGKAVVSTVQTFTDKQSAPKALAAPKGSAPLTPRPLTKVEVDKIMASRDWKKIISSPQFKQLTQAAALTRNPRMVEAFVAGTMASLAKRMGFFNSKPAPRVDRKALSARAAASAAASNSRSKVVAKIGTNQVPVTVVSKRAKGEIERPRVVSPKAEARVLSAVEELKAKLNQWSQENTPFSRLMIAGMQTVPV